MSEPATNGSFRDRTSSLGTIQSATTMTTQSPQSSQCGRITKLHRVSYGLKPRIFTDDDIERIEFDIFDFPNLPQKDGEFIFTNIIDACGHPWTLKVFPRTSGLVIVYLYYHGQNTEEDPVVAKAVFKTKTNSFKLGKHEYSTKHRRYGCRLYECWAHPTLSPRDHMILNDCDADGTLTITVEIQVGQDRRSVWYPQLNQYGSDIGSLLYKSMKASDVTFYIGREEKMFKLHKSVLAVRAEHLYELVVTKEKLLRGQPKNDNDKDDDDDDGNTKLILPDVDTYSFEVLVEFIYTNRVPMFRIDNGNINRNNAYTDDNDCDNENESNDENQNTISAINNREEEHKVKSILLVANQFSCSDLKMYMESILVDKFLSTYNAAELLLLADSYACALLKEAAMKMYASNSKEVMEFNVEEWTKLKESNDLLVELLIYTNNIDGQKKYSPVTTAVTTDHYYYANDGSIISTSSGIDDDDDDDDTNRNNFNYGTIDDADQFDVTSLRERLQKVNIDVDGSREMLVTRWKDYLLSKQTASERKKQNRQMNE